MNMTSLSKLGFTLAGALALIISPGLGRAAVGDLYVGNNTVVRITPAGVHHRGG